MSFFCPSFEHRIVCPSFVLLNYKVKRRTKESHTIKWTKEGHTIQWTKEGQKKDIQYNGQKKNKRRTNNTMVKRRTKEGHTIQWSKEGQKKDIPSFDHCIVCPSFVLLLTIVLYVLLLSFF
jgi:uncharacterized protein YxeA